MQTPTPEIKSEIKVDSYQKTASIGGWAGASRTLWAISALGIVFGAAIGIVAPFFPMLVGAALPALSTIGTSVAVFAATGLSMGFGGGMMLGRMSGTVAAVAEEHEKRMKEWTARQLKHNSPGAAIVPDEPKPEPEKKSLRQHAKDTYRSYFNPRVGAVFTLFGLAGGLILGAAFVASSGAAGAVMGGIPLLATLTGLKAAAITAPVIMSYSAGVCASFGALWFFNFPKLTSNITEFFGNLTSGKPLGREWEAEPAPAQQQAISAPEPTLCNTQARNFPSFQELIAQQANENSSTLAKH